MCGEHPFFGAAWRVRGADEAFLASGFSTFRGAWLLALAGGLTWLPGRPGGRAPQVPRHATGPRMYYPEDRGTPQGGAFWGRSTEEQWGEFASGEPGRFDKDDLVEAQYPGSEEVYCAQVGSLDGVSLERKMAI